MWSRQRFLVLLLPSPSCSLLSNPLPLSDHHVPFPRCFLISGPPYSFFLAPQINHIQKTGKTSVQADFCSNLLPAPRGPSESLTASNSEKPLGDLHRNLN